MGAVRLLVRSEVRRRWRSLVIVVLLVGFAGGATLAAVAGARRTSSSFDRFRESVRSHDVLVFAEGIGPSDVQKLRSRPGVAAVGYLRQLALTRPDGDFLAVGGPLDGAMFHDVNRLRIIDGRVPRPNVPEEVVVPEPLARQDHLKVGDALPFKSYSARADRRHQVEHRRSPRADGSGRDAASGRHQSAADRPQPAGPSRWSAHPATLVRREVRTEDRKLLRRAGRRAVRPPHRRRGRRRPVRRPAAERHGRSHLRPRSRRAEHRRHPGLDRHPGHRHPRVRRSRRRGGNHRARPHHQPPGRAPRGRSGRAARPGDVTTAARGCDRRTARHRGRDRRARRGARLVGGLGAHAVRGRRSRGAAARNRGSTRAPSSSVPS